MAKKRYTITLDEDVQELVANYLEGLGMSFSGFLNALLIELSKEIQGQPVMLDRKIEDLTIKEFGELSSYWFKRVREAEE